MRRRYLYVLLFAPTAVLLALVTTAAVVGASAGVLWLFVFGDDPWPAWSEPLLGALALAVGAAVATVLLWLAYLAGKRQEQRPATSRVHVALALGSAFTMAALVAVRVSGGVAAPRSNEERCAAFCRAAGFAASGTPPRNSGESTCTCYDAAGRPARVVHSLPPP
jgi:formate-dependent nitrite reductase membrane component NrfD